MKLGYSTITYDDSGVETAITDIRACQYDGIEVSIGDINEVGLESIDQILSATELEVFCLMGDWLESGDLVDTVARATAHAAELDADFLGLLPPRRGLVNDATFSSWLTDLCEKADNAGVQPVLHHHGGTHVESPEEITEWLRRSPDNLGLLFDTAHYYPYSGQSTEGVCNGFKKFINDIEYVHLKDIDPSSNFDTYTRDLTAAEFNLDSVINYFRTFTDLGHGQIDFTRFLKTIDSEGFEGPLTIEIENRIHDPLVHAKRNRDHLHNIIQSNDSPIS